MSKLIQNQTGAVMVMSVFFGIFLVAILYHLIGVGGAALEQQIMQDAADASVFSAATANARGMNMLVLINLIMVVVLAVLVALRLVQAILTVATAVVSVLCVIPWTSAVGCPMVTPLTDLTVQVSDLVGEVEDIVNEVLEGLNSAADLINQAVPYLAEAEAVYVTTRKQYNPAQVGFVWPVFEELPTKDGEFDTLCKKAAESVVDIVFFYLPDGIKEFLGSVVGGLAQTFSSYFCGGDGGGGPPNTTETVNVGYPANSDERCKPKDTDWSGSPSSEGQCNERGEIDKETCDCGNNTECIYCSKSGCNYCFPRLNTIDKGLWTIRRDKWREFFKEGETDENGLKQPDVWLFKEWIEEDRRWIKRIDGNPCSGLIMNSCNEGSAFSPRKSSNLEEGDDPPAPPDMICMSEEIKEQNQAIDSQDAKVRDIERTSYLYLHSCEIRTRLNVAAPEGSAPIEGGDDKVPRELDIKTYSDLSKMRSVVLGKGESKKRIKAVNIAATDPSNGALGERFSFAAAEYYSPNNDLWHLNWTTRFIRFCLSYDDYEEGSEVQSVFETDITGKESRSGKSISDMSKNSNSQGSDFLDSCLPGFFDSQCNAIKDKMGGKSGFSDQLEGMEGLGDKNGGFSVEQIIAH